MKMLKPVERTTLDENLPDEVLAVAHMVRERKATWTKTVGSSPKKCDMLPVVFPECKGNVLAIIMATDLDRDMALNAAYFCRQAMDADAITLILEAHVRHVESEDKDTFRERFPHNSMQRACDEEGACDLFLISDCLIVHRFEASGRITILTLPYKYHVNADKSNGPEFDWTPQGNNYADSNMSPGKFDGIVVKAIQTIMAKPSIHEGKEINEIAHLLGVPESIKRYHTARGSLKVLKEKGYVCADMMIPEMFI